MRIKKIMAVALAAAVAVGTAGISTPVKATEPEPTGSTYTVTIPAKLEVASKGWNETAGIKAKGTLESGKKLSITATSNNGDWKLKASGVSDTVGYNLATEDGTYSSAAEAPSWEFSASDFSAMGGETKAMGIIVEDYSSKAPGNYTDTVTFTAKVVDAAPANPYATKNVGDIVAFGNYNWYVIAKEDNDVTLLMEGVLSDTKKYHDSFTDITWANCSLRTYLNGEFYNTFTADEKKMIALTHNENPNNSEYGTSGGAATDDHIYLLSIDEFNALPASVPKATGSWWWLRSPVNDSNLAAYVGSSGSLYAGGSGVDREGGVRPALHLKF